jgi:Thiamine pyrophosphate enzyme, central domain
MSDHRRGPRRDRRGAQAEVEELAERTGALLATTLPARGIFDHNPFSIGIAGGYAHEIAREIGAQADLVVEASFGIRPARRASRPASTAAHMLLAIITGSPLRLRPRLFPGLGLRAGGQHARGGVARTGTGYALIEHRNRCVPRRDRCDVPPSNL